jgi:hypothetical protein
VIANGIWPVHPVLLVGVVGQVVIFPDRDGIIAAKPSSKVDLHAAIGAEPLVGRL